MAHHQTTTHHNSANCTTMPCLSMQLVATACTCTFDKLLRSHLILWDSNDLSAIACGRRCWHHISPLHTSLPSSMAYGLSIDESN